MTPSDGHAEFILQRAFQELHQTNVIPSFQLRLRNPKIRQEIRAESLLCEIGKVSKPEANYRPRWRFLMSTKLT
ncbi:unnamed protein product, partial [Nesidiocoris tenuis]